MNRIRQSILVLSLLVLPSAAAQAESVTFQVHMSQQVLLGYFDPAGDFVDLAGSFNDWGGSPLTPLSDADGDSLYTVDVGGFTAGDNIEYKFRINGQWDGTEEFPGIGNNRVYTVQAADNLIDVWYGDLGPGQGQIQPGPTRWWNDTVFYEIFVRSFKDSDGDGIGDLVGLTSQLDYLNDGDPNTDTDLGVTGIWLMPINDSPSYHGYDSVDYLSINPDYGTHADFETFLAAAHARGIKVIIDFVMNHCSNEHPWFQSARQGNPQYRDYFRWSATDPGENGPWGQNVWHWDSSGYYYGLFGGGMPDLNYDTPAVKDAMFASASWWLETIGVDGFRLDAVLYIDEDPGQLQTTPGTLQFWQDFGAQVRATSPEALTVGEAWTGSNTVVQYVADGRLDLCFEFDLSYAMLNGVNWGDASAVDFKASQVYNLYPYLQFATFLTNHDQDRSFNAVGLDEGKARAAAALYLSLPGVPFLYYGEEIGMQGTGYDPNKRAPMQWNGSANVGFTTGTPWEAVGAGAQQYNVQDEDTAPNSLLRYYRKLIHARNESSALRRGTFTPLSGSDSAVSAFLRADSLQTVLCLVNLSGAPVSGLTISGLASLVPGSYLLSDLLDPTHTLPATVTAENAIPGFALEGYGARFYVFSGASAVDPEGRQVPGMGLMLEQNVPNPFNPDTVITYNLPERRRVKLEVYDLRGRRVIRLRDEVQGAGPQRVRWDGRDDGGRAVGSGTYLVRLESGTESRQIKVGLLK